jgi:hypothetical protein
MPIDSFLAGLVPGADPHRVPDVTKLIKTTQHTK